MKIVKIWTLASLRKCYQTGDYFPAMHMLTVYRKYVGNAGEGGSFTPDTWGASPKRS